MIERYCLDKIILNIHLDIIKPVSVVYGTVTARRNKKNCKTNQRVCYSLSNRKFLVSVPTVRFATT